MNPVSAVIGGVAGFTALAVVFGCFYTVDQGERGVITRNGAVIGVAQPGLGFKLPIVDGVRDFSVQTHIQTFDKLHAYSFDQQPAEVKLSVNYRLRPDKVAEIYETYGTAENVVSRVIAPAVQQKSKIVFGGFTAVKAIQDRAWLNAEVAETIQHAVDGPVVIESVQIENIDFSKAYEASIEQRMLAEVEVQRIRQNAEREKVNAEITVTQARAQADSTRQAANAAAENTMTRARADAEAYRLATAATAERTKLYGEAEAISIKAKGDALRENPGLVALTQAERWDGKLPATMVPGSALPMLSIR